METKCRFPSCHWTGDANDLFDHCETCHRKYMKEISASNSFSFTFEEVLHDTFLLNGNAGLYWFTIDPEEVNDECTRRGVFAVGDSEVCTYTVKIGRVNDGYVTYMGPYQTRPDTSDEHDLEWTGVHFQLMYEEIASRRMELFFGEFDETEQYKGTYLDVDWDDPEEEQYNQLCLEKFTCFVCFDYIKSHARSCESGHFLCNECPQKLIEQGKPWCPMCKSDFRADLDEDIEDLLRCVRFPDDE